MVMILDHAFLAFFRKLFVITKARISWLHQKLQSLKLLVEPRSLKMEVTRKMKTGYLTVSNQGAFFLVKALKISVLVIL